MKKILFVLFIFVTSFHVSLFASAPDIAVEIAAAERADATGQALAALVAGDEGVALLQAETGPSVAERVGAALGQGIRRVGATLGQAARTTGTGIATGARATGEFMYDRVLTNEIFWRTVASGTLASLAILPRYDASVGLTLEHVGLIMGAAVVSYVLVAIPFYSAARARDVPRDRAELFKDQLLSIFDNSAYAAKKNTENMDDIKEILNALYNELKTGKFYISAKYPKFQKSFQQYRNIAEAKIPASKKLTKQKYIQALEHVIKNLSR